MAASRRLTETSGRCSGQALNSRIPRFRSRPTSFAHTFLVASSPFTATVSSYAYLLQGFWARFCPNERPRLAPGSSSILVCQSSLEAPPSQKELRHACTSMKASTRSSHAGNVKHLRRGRVRPPKEVRRPPYLSSKVQEVGRDPG